jgi:hypothetical protein
MIEQAKGTDSASRSDSTQTARRLAFGLSIMLFPIMLLVGFVTHPNILSVSMVTDLDTWVLEWRTHIWFHIGHLIVMFAVPFVIFSTFALSSLLKAEGAWYGVVGAVLSVFGAFLLAVDKGALTFVLTAFKDLPDDDFAAISPALEAIFQRDGWLWITWGFAALPVGFIILTIGLLKEEIVRRWQGICIILGLLLLMNPDIEIISSAGALLMCAGFLPIGWAYISGQMADIPYKRQVG